MSGDWRDARVETIRGLILGALPDPASVFNASLTAGTRRAIDLPEDAELDEAAFADLIRAAVDRNRA